MILENLALKTPGSWLCEISEQFPHRRLELMEFHPFMNCTWRGILRIDAGCEDVMAWLSQHSDISNLILLSNENIVHALKQKHTTGTSGSNDCYIGFQSSCHKILCSLVVKYNVFLLPPIHLREGIIEFQAFSTETNLNAFYLSLSEEESSSLKMKRKISVHSLRTPLLTPKQESIKQVALDLGYYDIPRKVNLIDLSAHFQVSQSTMSEHLRKIEKTVMNLPLE